MLLSSPWLPLLTVPAHCDTFDYLLLPPHILTPPQPPPGLPLPPGNAPYGYYPSHPHHPPGGYYGPQGGYEPPSAGNMEAVKKHQIMDTMIPADSPVKDPAGCRELTKACEVGDRGTVRRLFPKVYDPMIIGTGSANHRPPHYWACRRGRLDVVRELVEIYKCNPHTATRSAVAT